MSCYLSFFDKEVFAGVTSLEETSSNPAEEAEPHSKTTIPAFASKEQATRKISQEPAEERKSPKFPWMGKKCCTHPGLWWLLDSSLAHQEAQSGLICLWSIIIGILG